MLKNRKIKRNWNDEDSKIIIWTVSKYIQSRGIQQIRLLVYILINFQNQQDWRNIASYIPGATDDSCMYKILSLKKIKLSE